MVAVKLNNSVSRIEGLNPKQFKELRDILSYKPDAVSAYFSGNYNAKRYLLNKRGEFPTGLWYLVDKYLKNIESFRAVTYSVADNRRHKEVGKGLFTLSLEVTPYPEQREAVEACLHKHRGILSVPTGVGKSLIAVLLVNKLQVPTLVVVPSLELKRQLSETMVEAFGADKVGKGKAIWVENVHGLDTKKPIKGYDCVIVDEFHHSGAKTYRVLNKNCWNDIYYRFGLTATPFRSKDNERILLESVLSEVIYRVDYKTATAKGYIAPVEAYYFDLPKIKVKGRTWAEVYRELVVNREDRNKLIAGLLDSARLTGRPTLCLVKEIEHGLNIRRAAEYAHPFAKGENDDNSELLKELERANRSTLIGTTGVLGEGVDTKPAEFIIIAGLGKSKNALMQQVGRGVRKYPGKDTCKVILFRDPSHRFTRDHFNTQTTILLDEYGAIPVCLGTGG